MDDTPLMPKKRGMCTKYVITWSSVFFVSIIIMVSIIVISDFTVNDGMLIQFIIIFINYWLFLLLIYLKMTGLQVIVDDNFC